MAKFNPTGAWNALSHKRQWAILLRLVRNIHKKGLPPGAMNVGAGYKTYTTLEKRKKFAKTAGLHRTKKRPAVLVESRSHPRVLTSRLCVRFYVERKLKKPKEPLPTVWPMYVTTRGRRRLCHIPTDVTTYHGGKPQCYFVSSNATSTVEAAACCIVVRKSDPSDQYILGCHHSFTLSMTNSNNPAPLPIEIRYKGETAILANTADWTELKPSNGEAGFDAALARRDSSNALPDCLLRNLPTRIMTNPYPPKSLIIHTPRRDIAAEYVDYLPSKTLRYGTEDLEIGPVFQFWARTEEGDSGSAVMAGDTLYGMHFYGNTAAQTAIALPADELFRSGRFGVAIRLP